MSRKIHVVLSFLIMLCLGSIYSWSIFVPELINDYGLKASQTQLVFGTVIGVFTITMIFAAKLMKKFGPRLVATLSGLLFGLGYLIAFFSNGSFFTLWVGIGLFGGIGTGLGYLVSISLPVKWFPEKKGLVTGIASAGFGAGAIVLSFLVELFLQWNIDVLTIFLITGISYGTIITLSARRLAEPEISAEQEHHKKKINFLNDARFYQLFIGIFGGTFTGLLIIGNLKPIGMADNIDEFILVLGIVLFSVANFTGRLVWGWLSDYVNNLILIPLALLFMGISAILLGYLELSGNTYLILALTTGFSFGANFVLFAKETIHFFSLTHYSRIYPYVLLGYGIAGVFGPTFGGWFYDMTGSYVNSLLFSFILCLLVAVTYILFQKVANRKTLMTESTV